MTSYCRAPLTFAAHQKPTVGDSKFSAVLVDHMGWLLCDGRCLAVADFRFLFNVIGYSFGGSGDTFNLPEMCGRVPGAIGSNSLTSNGVGSNFILGQDVGEYVHQLTYPEMPSHNHGVAPGFPSTQQLSTNIYTSSAYTLQYLTDPQHKHTGITDDAGWAASNVTTTPGSDQAADDAGSHNHTFTTDNNSTGIVLVDPGHNHVLNPAGLDQFHNNVQPTLFMGNMFIYCGLYNFGTFPYQNSYVSTIQ
jgi:microcystin-dependent protein